MIEISKCSTKGMTTAYKMSMSNAQSRTPPLQSLPPNRDSSRTSHPLSLPASTPPTDPAPPILVVRCPLFPQHSLIDARQRPNPSPNKHPHTPARNPLLHHPCARARAPTPHIHHPRGDGLDRVETDCVVPALPFQIDEPAPEQW